MVLLAFVHGLLYAFGVINAIKVRWRLNMSHYGVIAYSDGFQPPYPGFCYGQKKLIDGLWFHSNFIEFDDE